MNIVVTSMAWRTPLGNDLQGVWNRLCAGDLAATENHRIASEGYRCRLGAPLSEEPKPGKNRKFLKRIGLSAVECAREAFLPLSHDGFEPDRVGLFFSYGGLRADWDEMRHALMRQSPDSESCWNRGLGELHPFWILKHLSNNAHALTAEELRIQGEGVTFGGLNSGAQAIAAATNALRIGAVDQALVVSHDSLLEPETVVALGEKGVLSTSRLDSWIAPYDPHASGFVPGEATAAVLLERSNDSPRPGLASVEAIDVSDGEALLPFKEALIAGLRRLPRGADLIDGAGTGNAAWDLQERATLAEFVAPNTPLTCSLSAMGQLGASSSIVQLIALIHALNSRRVHPIAGLRKASEGPLQTVINAREMFDLRSAIGVSAGFPGLLGLIRVEVLG